MPSKRCNRPKPVARPLEGSKFARLLLRMHGRRRALEIAEQVMASHQGTGDVHSANVWQGIASDIRRTREDRG